LCNLVFKFNLNDSMNSGKRLFLLDAYALIFRGYYAFIKNPILNSKGLNTSAVYGFMNSLLDLIWLNASHKKPALPTAPSYTVSPRTGLITFTIDFIRGRGV